MASPLFRTLNQVTDWPLNKFPLLFLESCARGMTDKEDQSRCGRFVRRSKVSPTAKDDGLLEGAQVRFGRRQSIVNPGDFLLEEHFSLVTLRREWVKGVSEAVVEDCQLGDGPG